MKTAISIPDDIFFDAENTAQQLGLARSQLYVKAIKEFIIHHNKEAITEKLNNIYSDANIDKNDFLDIGIHNLRSSTKNDSW